MESDIYTKLEVDKGWSKKLLYQLVESVKDYAIFAADLDGCIVSWNIGAEKIFGYTAKEAIGQNCRILFTESDRAQKVPEMELKKAREKGCAEDERWHLRKDGSKFFASGLMSPLYEADKKHTGYAKIARDLTERIKFETDLQQAKDHLEIKVFERTNELNESNESLRREINQHRESQKLRVALLRKIVKTQEDERKRIAREIHDQVGQQITALQLNFHSLLEEYKDDSELCRKINRLKSIGDRIDSEVDFLAWELRPSVLDDLGLVAALKDFVREWSVHFQIPAEFHHRESSRKPLTAETEINLYRIVQEALNNILKHAHAKNVSVLFEQRDGTIFIIIEDDGIGFKVGKKAVLTGENKGMGLLGMKERAELVGGTLEVETSAGKGTTIYVRAPAKLDEPEKQPRP